MKLTFNRLVWLTDNKGNFITDHKGKPRSKIITDRKSFDMKAMFNAPLAKNFLKDRVLALIDDVFDHFENYTDEDKEAVAILFEYINNENAEKFEKYDTPVP